MNLRTAKLRFNHHINDYNKNTSTPQIDDDDNGKIPDMNTPTSTATNGFDDS
jgi:hypothetical protein